MVSSWKDLSLREKIGQTVMLQAIPEDHIQKSGSIEQFLQEYPIGAIFATGKLENAVMFGIEQFGSQMRVYKDNTKIPLLFSADMENGTTTDNNVLFPYLIALAATDDLDLAYDFGRALAIEARSAGINWLFSPVVDIALYPLQSTDLRALGDNPERIVAMASRIMDGMMDCGVMPTAKHFPDGGHQKLDAHLVRVQTDCSRELWEATNGYIYRKLIKHGVPAIMTAHSALPSAQTQRECEGNGLYRICTLSKELTTGLLKGDLGFEGVVVSDALVMGGFSGSNSMKNMIECFLAGTDVLLWPPVEYIDELEKEIIAGNVPMSRLDDAVSRVWALKEKLGLFEEDQRKTTMPQLSDTFLRDVSRRICEGCLTMVRNENGRIPFCKDNIKKALVVSVTPNDEDHATICTIKESFNRRGIEAEVWRDTWTDKLDEEKQKEYDLILFAISRLPHRPIGSMDLYGNNACSIWALHTCDPTKTVSVSFGTPYIYRYFTWDDMYINAYSTTEDMMEAFVSALFGEIPFAGTSPVDLKRALV